MSEETQLKRRKSFTNVDINASNQKSANLEPKSDEKKIPSFLKDPNGLNTLVFFYNLIYKTACVIQKKSNMAKSMACSFKHILLMLT